jgi:hypothetical protein
MGNVSLAQIISAAKSETLIAALLMAIVFPSTALCKEPAKAPQAPLLTAAQLIDRFQQVVASWEDYSYTAMTDKNGRTETYKFYFKRPDLVRVDTGRGEVAVQPDGSIRGRRGRGWFGRISRRLGRDDRRLLDEEGVPFYECHFAAKLERIQDLIKQGATAVMEVLPDAYCLEVRSGDTVWTYTLARATLIPLGCSRTVKGKVMDATICLDFRCNVGLSTGLFKF